MKKSKRILLTILAAVMAFCMLSFVACGGELDGILNSGNTTVTLSATTSTLQVGESTTLTATVEGSDSVATWMVTPNDESVIKIVTESNTCSVTAVAEGTAKVRAIVGTKYAECVVTVKAEGTEPDEVTVTLSKTHTTLKVGETDTITATVTGTDEPVDWAVVPDGNTKVTITPDGNSCTITAVAEGSACVAAIVGDENVECTVTVTGDGIADGITVHLDKTTASVKAGETTTLTAEVTGADTVSWTVTPSDNSVVTIASDGNTCTVTGVAEGNATVTAYIDDKFAECAVAVTPADEPPVEVTVALDKTTATVKAGETAALTATVTGTEDTVTWTVTPSEGVVTIANEGNTCTVAGVAAGNATVTATVGGKTATCEVTVTASAQEDLPEITTWDFVGDAIYGEVHENDTDYIYHHLYFNDVVEQAYDFDGFEATVTLDGVTGVINTSRMDDAAALGHAYHLHIRVVGNRYQTTVLTIKFKKGDDIVAIGKYTREGDKEITLDSVNVTISKGATETINILSVNGKEDLTGLTINWSVEGTGVATIPANSNGSSVVVTAVAEGEATLTCTIGEGDGAFSKTCKITVVEGAVVIVAVDVSSQYNFSNKFQAGGEAIQVFFNLQGPDYADLVQQIDTAKTEVAITMDGAESTSNVIRKEWQAPGTYNLWIQVVVASDWTHDYEFRFSFKNAKGDEVAYATHTEAAPKEIHLSSTRLSLTLKDGETVTETLTATKTGAVAGDITWSIDSTDYATIVVSEDKLSVTVTAVAKGTATITATADGVTATCEVTVLEAGEEVKTPTITDFRKFEGPYGDGRFYKFIFEESDENVDLYPDIKASFDHTDVNGAATDHREFYQGGGAKTYIVTVHFSSEVVSGTTYKIDLCDASGNVLCTFSWTAD